MPRAYDRILNILNRLNNVRQNIDNLNQSLMHACPILSHAHPSDYFDRRLMLRRSRLSRHD